jgi:hypothetical protein
MQCEEFKQVIDSYLSDELLVETNHEVQRHVDGCSACRTDLAARRALRSQVRAAIYKADESQIDKTFADRLARDLRNSAHERPRWTSIFQLIRIRSFRFAAAAIILVIAAAGAAIYLSSGRPPGVESVTTRPNTTADFAVAAQRAWSELAQTAIGDHENCAVKFNLAERPITLQAAAVEHGQFNADLDTVITTVLHQQFPDQSGEDVEFLESHYCVYAGQRFAHIVMRQRGQKVSILVADTASPDVDPLVTEHAASDGLTAGGFTIKGHAVFVVSDLPVQTNYEIANALRPALGSHAEKFGV